jgi:hypothetical protein
MKDPSVSSPNILKTDGTYLYSLSNSTLSIILAYPAQSAKVVSILSLYYSNPSTLFV